MGSDCETNCQKCGAVTSSTEIVKGKEVCNECARRLRRRKKD